LELELESALALKVEFELELTSFVWMLPPEGSHHNEKAEPPLEIVSPKARPPSAPHTKTLKPNVFTADITNLLFDGHWKRHHGEFLPRPNPARACPWIRMLGCHHSWVFGSLAGGT
jgi:hypothetical protein